MKDIKDKCILKLNGYLTDEIRYIFRLFVMFNGNEHRIKKY